MRHACRVFAAAATVAAALTCAAAAADGARVAARPAETLVDERVTIAVSGVRPRERVTIRATTTDADGRAWRSSAVFRADRRGRVNVPAARSLAGTYRGRDGMGLFWSMAPVARGAETRFVPPAEASFALAAIARGRVLARATVRRLGRARDVERSDLTLERDGLVGRFSVRRGAASGPGVLYLGGSEGGVPSGRTAGVLASRGFPVLELAYFGAPGLPATLSAIPLEYFARALEWLAARPEVDPRRLVIFGVSRGGEAALLLGATYPDRVAGVIAYVPSSVVNPSPGGGSPAWTLGGRPLPHVPASDLGNPAPANQAAIIPVERIPGPVLLVSGGQDAIWPSSLYAEAIVRRRAASGKPTTSLSFLGAGHAVGAAVPHVPAAPIGGTRAADAAARARAWPQVLELLGSLRTAWSL